MFHRMMNYGEMDPKPTVVLTRELIKKTLPKYRRHDDMIIVSESAWDQFKRSLPIPVAHEENSPFSIDEDELASLVCQTLQKPSCHRLAIDKGVNSDDYRTPNVDLVLGDNGIVTHKENHLVYRFDVTKCMFSFGNINEKMRMGELECSEEIVVDLFAGIGYFSLPLLFHAKAKHLYACEWNPDAIDALKKNLSLNKIDSDKYTIIEGDNKINRPTDVAQRIILGILPSCSDWMKTAFECIDKSTGAILHCHDLVETKPAQLPTPEKVIPDNLSEAPSLVDDKTSSATESLLNQSISSNSSHSTIERLSNDNKTQSSESDKDTSSPVLLERPSSSGANISYPSSDLTNNSNLNETTSLSSFHNEESVQEVQVTDQEYICYEVRGQMLIDAIRQDIDAHDLVANIVNIQPVKSYGPNVNHVVFDIKIEPKIKSKCFSEEFILHLEDDEGQDHVS